MNNRKIITILLAVILNAANLLAYDTLSTKQIYPGCYLYELADTGMPVMIYMAKIDLRNSNIKVSLGIAYDSLNLGGERTSDFAKRKVASGRRIIAAVNADFFGDSPMQSQNSMIRDGKIIKATNLNRTQIAFDKYTIPQIGRFVFDGFIILDSDTLSIDAVNSQDSTLPTVVYTSDWTGPISNSENRIAALFEYDGMIENNIPEKLSFVKWIAATDTTVLKHNQIVLQIDASKSNVTQHNIKTCKAKFVFEGLTNTVSTLTAGLPGLFTEAMIPDTYLGKEGMKSERFLGKNPRTAVGYSKDKSTLILVAVDGRQQDYSMGMSMMELAEFMKEMGCYDALNFDGGGSTTMVIGDTLVNSPSDITGERPVYNSLVIYADE